MFTSVDREQCQVCGACEWVAFRQGTDLCRPNHKKIFKLSRCLHCGHVTQVPAPTAQELDAAYSVTHEYACYRPAWKEEGWPIWKVLRTWTTRRRINWLTRLARRGDLLEVGCGAGDFLLSAHRAGWRVSAVEYNLEMVETLKSNFSFDVKVGALAPDSWETASFDVVALWNVLEHLRDPQKELEIAAGYLKPGGKLLLNIPSRQAAERGRSFGEDWALLDIPRHIHFFDRHSLSLLCQKVGLGLSVYKTPFVQSAWCYYMSCWNWASRRGAFVRCFALFAARAAGVTLMLPYVAFEAWSGRGLEAFAVAEKLPPAGA